MARTNRASSRTVRGALAVWLIAREHRCLRASAQFGAAADMLASLSIFRRQEQAPWIIPNCVRQARGNREFQQRQ
jgi:hypothetical protein